LNKKTIVSLLVLALVAVACATDTGTEEAADVVVEETETLTSTLDIVKERGFLKCGVSGSAVAFSETQADGSVTGIDADYCYAIAAAVFGDYSKVEFTALTAAERFTALSASEVDVLIRNTTWTQSRDTELGNDFGPTTYYDGQQLMGKVVKGLSASSTLKDVADNNLSVCTNAGTTTEKNITEGVRQYNPSWDNLVTVEAFPEAMEKFKADECDIVTTDGSGLVGNRAKEGALNDWAIFPSAPISKEPLGPVYRQNDSKWADVVNWTVYATFIADEYGVGKANIGTWTQADWDANPEMGRLMGKNDGELQTVMGLSADAFYNVIAQVGNYDEIYSKNLNPVGLYREGSANASWTDGGLIYAPPAR
jgi:general L-amino acid transport system substrate-binding protein